jgi:16S rRNA (cytosine967-C5)-methyltransferase
VLSGVPSAREVAAHVLSRVIADRAWIAPTLTTELDRYPQLETRERALATELVYGTVRAYGWLAREVTNRTKTKRIDDEIVLAHMLVAAYQALLLDRSPAHAAIDAAVDGIRSKRGKQVAGFGNAVLRRVVSEVKRPAPETVARESVPAWLRKKIEASLGVDAARAFLEGRLGPPPVALRMHDPSERDTWLTRLAEAAPGAHFAPADLAGCILADGAGRLEALPGFDDAWVPQDYGSQWIAARVGAKPGEHVLDACAGRGQKTGLLARAVMPGGAVDAADLHPKKLVEIAGARTFGVDWTKGTGDAAARYDRILVDAPCSGTGTIGRRPEILLRLREADIANLRATQLAIATRVASLLAPGGTLVYATCSLLRDEGEDVIEALRAQMPELGPAQHEREEPWITRLLPPERPTDGYFVATLVRK